MIGYLLDEKNFCYLSTGLNFKTLQLSTNIFISYSYFDSKRCHPQTHSYLVDNYSVLKIYS